MIVGFLLWLLRMPLTGYRKTFDHERSSVLAAGQFMMTAQCAAQRIRRFGTHHKVGLTCVLSQGDMVCSRPYIRP